jgi:hypothetical protein
MADDPHPEFRCRCVNRIVWIPELAHLLSPADPYYDRCPERPTQEDGLCDHCRQPEGACTGCDGRGCCRHPSQSRRLVDLATPCLDRSLNPEEVPF